MADIKSSLEEMAKKSGQEVPTPPPSVEKPAPIPPPQPAYTWAQATSAGEKMQDLLSSIGIYREYVGAIRVKPNMFTEGVPSTYGQHRYWDKNLESSVESMNSFLITLGDTCRRFQNELPRLQQMQKFLASEIKEAKAQSTLDMGDIWDEIGPGLAQLRAKQAQGGLGAKK